MRNTADSVGKLHYLAEFGLKLGGTVIRETLQRNLEKHRSDDKLDEADAWFDRTCACIGSYELRRPPDAIENVRAILRRTLSNWNEKPSMSGIDADLLESWRAAAKDIDDQIFIWLPEGGPAGILHAPVGLGIFPDCPGPLGNNPADLQCDTDMFRNYPGVEEQAVIEEELQSLVDAKRLAGFDSLEELSDFVGATPESPVIRNKTRFIVKIRNGVSKALMILDTKQSGVKKSTGKFQRVTLPRLFDAVIRLLLLTSFVIETAADAVSASVLDYTEAFWQVPITPSLCDNTTTMSIPDFV